jgi:hypothetical protein
MATIPGQEFASWTAVPGGGGGLGTVAAAYLAHKAGLIDLNNKDQMSSVQKNGILGHMAMKALDGAVKPPAAVNAPVAPVTVGGPMNQELPQGVPLESMPPVETSNIETSGLDHEMIDSSLPNFATLFA